MSYPILYGATETNFDNNGIGILSACVSCEVTEEANGMFELAMRYPMDGIHFAEIGDRSIIKAKADQFREPQLFRVYAISKPMSGIVTVLAEHISYDLSGIPVKPFSAYGVSLAMTGLKNNAVVDCPFDFWTDKITTAEFKVDVPSSIRSRFGGVSGSILDVYGGEYEFDNFMVRLHNQRGKNRGVSIRYGKNLKDIQQDQNCASVATGIYPYWAGEVEGKTVLVELPEKIVKAPGTYNFVRIRTIDFSSEFETQPTVEQLRSKANNFAKANNIGVPSVSLTVSFAQLEQTEEYKSLKLLERVSLFDTVNVEFPALGVSTTAKAVKMVFDVISERVKSVTLGSVRANIAGTIANQQQEIAQAPTKNDIKRAQEAATAWLTNGKGFKVERRDANGNVIDTLYMDKANIQEARNVLRIGQSGIGFSANGVDGPYYSAWTLDGKFNANFISGGVISSQDGKVHISLVGGEEPVRFSSEISTNGLKVRGDSVDSENIFFARAVEHEIADGSKIETFAVGFKSTDGHTSGGFSETFDTGTKKPIGMNLQMFSHDEKNKMLLKAGTNASFELEKNGSIVGRFGTTDSGKSELRVDKIGDLEVFWKDNEDGTYTMCGR